jgi:hypothetical protein
MTLERLSDARSDRLFQSRPGETSQAVFGTGTNRIGKQHMLGRIGLGLLIGAAFAGPAAAQGSTRFDGQYVGELKLTAVVSGDCTEPPLGATYPLTVSGGRVEFKYVPRFDTTLAGIVDAHGRFKASRRLRRGVVSMTGHIEGGNVVAHIVSPSCNYTFRTRN